MEGLCDAGEEGVGGGAEGGEGPLRDEDEEEGKNGDEEERGDAKGGF